jgi:adenylylsulfate kinase
MNKKNYKILKNHLIIWLTGQSGAGKTSIANALQRKIGGIILDGDEMRDSISKDLGFTKKDREIHNLRVARLAKILSKNNNVLVSVIAPFENIRKKINKIIKPIWIYVDRDLPINKNKPYQTPIHYHIKLNSDKQKLNKQIKLILKYLRSQKLFKK